MFAHNMHRLLSGSDAYVVLLQNPKRDAAKILPALYSLQTSYTVTGIIICLMPIMQATSNPTFGKSVALPA